MRGTLFHSGLLKELTQLSALQILNLRSCRIDCHVEHAPVTALLAALPNLHELDIACCNGLWLVPSDCTGLYLSSLTYDYDQVMYHGSCRDSKLILAEEDISSQEMFWSCMLCIGSILKCTHQEYSWSLVELILDDFLPGDVKGEHLKLPVIAKLQVLDIRFALEAFGTQAQHLFECASSFSLGPGFSLTQFYMSGSRFSSYDLTACTTLNSVGIAHKFQDASIDMFLPIGLTSVCLHNMPNAALISCLDSLADLVSLKLGGSKMDELPLFPA